MYRDRDKNLDKYSLQPNIFCIPNITCTHINIRRTTSYFTCAFAPLLILVTARSIFAFSFTCTVKTLNTKQGQARLNLNKTQQKHSTISFILIFNSVEYNSLSTVPPNTNKFIFDILQKLYT